MSLSADFLSNQTPAIIALVGETATHTAGEVATEITAIRETNTDLRPGETTKSQAQGKRVLITFQSGIITPARGDTLAFTDATYTVHSIIENDGLAISVIGVETSGG